MTRVAIRSAIPGRERWQIEPIRSRPRYAAALERELSRHAPVRYAWANPLSGRLLVQYDRGVACSEVQDRVHASLGIEPLSPGELHDWRGTWPRGFNRSADEIAVAQARTRLILSGTLFAGLLAKRALFGAGMFAGSPALVTASSVMTIITGYTALRRGFDTATGIVGVNGRTMLTVATLALHIAAESIDGLGAVAAAHAFELLETKSVAGVRTMIRTLELPPTPPQRVPPPKVFTTAHDAALLAAGGMYLATGGDYGRSLAMLIGAQPLTAREALVAANAISLHMGLRRGIYFRESPSLLDPDEVAIAVLSRSLPEDIAAASVLVEEPEAVDEAVRIIRRTSALMNQDRIVSNIAGLAGFAAAAVGRLPSATASRLHNYTRLAMELNSLRLAWS
jgi:cation transport ATPase